MRIAWWSNSPWAPSGYGEQTGLFVPRIQSLGHDMAIFANYGLQGAKFPLADIPVYPANVDWGNDVLGSFVEDFGADLVIALCDAWVLRPDRWPDVKVAVWAPIDHYPIPPAVLAVLNHEKVRPIAMSRFGEMWMQRFKLDPLYVPHGVDTELFRPQPEIRNAVRDELDIPRDAFLVGMVAANKGSPQFPRKSFPQALDAFARFSRDHKDAWLYCHTQNTQGGHGIDIDELARVLHVDGGFPLDRFRMPSQKVWDIGLPKAVIANLYQAFDVLLNPSMGEGFGIPILEAQACGVPVITSDHSAMTELTGAGWLVEGDRYWDALQSSFAFLPSIASIHEALEKAYERRDDADLRESAVQFAAAYDADRVTDLYWQPALEALERPREVTPLNGKSRQVRRAEARAAAKT